MKSCNINARFLGNLNFGKSIIRGSIFPENAFRSEQGLMDMFFQEQNWLPIIFG